MRNRLECLRLLAMLVFISATLLSGGVGAQEGHPPVSLSFLPMLYGQCPWGYRLTEGQCQPIETPAHAFLDSGGQSWECERGYRRSKNRCLPVEVPTHAFLNLSGHDWECERGYERTENQCVEVNVPVHAYLDYFGDNWVCERGYKPVENQCIPIELPTYAHLDFTGNDWECDRGFERANDTCQPAWSQLKTPAAQALALAVSPETQRTVKQLQGQLKQAGYNPGPIDGILGPKTLAALQHYIEAQERPPTQTSTPPSHETDGM